MNQKNQKGITLIALVITIIVLLILAGVTINMVLGDDGIIANAQMAKKANKKANIEDAIQLLALEKKTAQHIGDDTGYPDEAQEVINYFEGKGIVDEDELTVADKYTLIDLDGTEYSLTELIPWGTTDFLIQRNGILEWVDPPMNDLEEIEYDGDIYIPEGTTTIPDEFFARVTANNIYIPNTVTTIGNAAFQFSHVSTIYIPSSVNSVGISAFECSDLTSVTMGAGVPLRENMFYYCQNLSSVKMGEGATSVLSGCFSYTAISEITIPSTVTTIGDGAFDSASNLTTVTLPNGLVSIGDAAFGGAPITTINFPANLKNIGNFAFGGAQFENVTLPEGLATIGDGAFSYCDKLESITIPSSIISIGMGAFEQVSGTIYINNGNTYNKFNVTEEMVNEWATTLSQIEFLGDMSIDVSDLKVGDNVTYVDGSGNEYDSVVIKEGANPEIVVLSGKEVTIGGNNFDTVYESYNNAYLTINAAANSYINTKFAQSARALNTTGATTLTTTDIELVTYGTKPFTDYTSYCTFENETLGDYDWFANYSAPAFRVDYMESVFDIYATDMTAEYPDVLIGNRFEGDVNGDGEIAGEEEIVESYNTATFNIAPVITLQSGIKIVDGNGTDATPFVLGE